MLHTISMKQALSVWSDLVRAYNGMHHYGCTDAEIYAYRLQRYRPSVHVTAYPIGEDVDEAAREAAAALTQLCEMFAKEFDCLVLIEGLRPSIWNKKQGGEFTHRCVVSVDAVARSRRK